MSIYFAFWLSAQRSLVFVWVERAARALTFYPIAAYSPGRRAPSLRAPRHRLALRPPKTPCSTGSSCSSSSSSWPGSPRPSSSPSTEGPRRPPGSSPATRVPLSRTRITRPRLLRSPPDRNRKRPGSFPRRRCEPLMVYGNLVGLLVAIIIVCKFLPQLHASSTPRVPLPQLSHLRRGCRRRRGGVRAKVLHHARAHPSSWLPRSSSTRWRSWCSA